MFGLRLTVRIEDEDDAVCVPLHGGPAGLVLVTATAVPQLHLGLQLQVVMMYILSVIMMYILSVIVMYILSVIIMYILTFIIIYILTVIFCLS